MNTHTTKNQSNLLRMIAAVLLVFSGCIALWTGLSQPTTVYAGDAAIDGLGLDNDNRNYKPDEFGCFSKQSGTNSLVGCASYGVYLFMVLVAKLAAAVGVLLNYAVMELVVGMGILVGNIPGVVIAWQALRDLVTVFLVFLTIFIGLATIMNVSRFGYKQLLMKVILAALFVNFSITLAKVVIDLANITALESYSMLLKQSPLDLSACTNALTQIDLGQGTNNVCLDNGIATIFWSKLKIMSIMRVDPNQLVNQQSTMLVTFVMGSLMFIVLAYVIGAGAFLLVGRFVTLVYLIIVSPIGLVAWITGISGKGREWWTTLINQSILAPFLFLSWWVVLVVTDGLGNRYNVQGFGPESFTSVGGLGVFVHFVIIIALLIISLRTATSLGGAAAKKAMGAYDYARGKAGGALAFAGGAAAVYGGGYASARLADHYRNARAKSEEMKDGEYVDKSNTARLMRSTVGKSKIIDRTIQRGLEAPSKKSVFGVKSYAARTEEVQKLQQARDTELKVALPRAKLEEAIAIINDPTGSIRSYNPQKYADAVKTLQGAKADDLAYVKNKLKSGVGTDWVGKSTAFDTPEIQEALTKKQAAALSARPDTTFEEKQKYNAIANRDVMNALKEHPGEAPGSDADADTHAAFEAQKKKFEEEARKAMASTSDDDIINNLSVYRNNPELLKHVSAEQHGRIMKKLREEGNDADAEKLSQGRYSDINTQLDAIDTEQDPVQKQLLLEKFRKTIRQLDTSDIEQLNNKVKDHPLFSSSLSQSQFEHLTKTKRGSTMPAQVEKLKQDRKAYFEQAILDGSIKSELEGMSPKQIASLGSDILSKDQIIQYLDTHTIKLLATSEDGLEARRVIKGKVDTQYNTTIKTKLETARREAVEAEERRVAGLSETERLRESMSGNRSSRVPSDADLARRVLTSEEQKIQELYTFFSSNTNGPRV